jgi:regulator of sigma D
MSNATRTLRHRYATTTVDGYFTLADQTFGECRQRVISYLVKLNRALNADLPDLSQALLSRFCDALVDYLSEGHFRVFQRLSLPAQSYALIEATTQAGMAFNDRFGDLNAIRVADVKCALEQVARVLSARFELEDELLYAEPY